MMDPLDPLIEGYLDYLTSVGRKAARTVVDVRCTLRRTTEDMEHIRPEVPLWRLRLEDYLRWLERERQQGRSSASLAKKLSHLRGFLEYAWRSGRTERNVLDGFQVHDTSPTTRSRSLTLEEAQRLIEAAPRGSRLERRNRVMLLLLYGCGLRTFELRDLDVGDVDQERRELRILKAKGDRPRIVPIPDGVYTEVLAYLLERGGKRGAMFRTEAKRRRITTNHVAEVVRDAARRAGIEGRVTPRTLRHSFATHLMDRGVDLAVIASLMGHRSPSETGVYLHVLPMRRESAVRELDREERG